MIQLGFHINADKCLGCYSCAMACKNMYHQPEASIWRRIYPLDQQIYPHVYRAFYSLACNHCENPACLRACPVAAYTKRKSDGVVIHDQDRCIGCGNCIRACPFGAPQYNPELKKAEKCSFCHQRLDQQLDPACVLACPVDALELIRILPGEPPGGEQYPPGFPQLESLNPSVRFTPARLPGFAGKGEK